MSASRIWSLSTEEQFYILWPALVVIHGRKILPFAILAFTALSMSVYWKGITYTSGLSLRPEMNAHMLLAGCLLAVVFANYPSAERWMKRWSRVLMPLSVLGIAIHLVVQRIVAPPTEAICIAIAIGASGPSSLLDWKPLTYLGKVSYSIYLWQQMFLMSLFGWICLPLSLGMGILSYIYIEQPCIMARCKDHA
jgi:peptidoglycan/LPS O-acetylase OafA/YrhL